MYHIKPAVCTLWTVGSPLCMVDHLDIALFDHRNFARGLGGKLSITLEPSPCNDKGLNVVPAARLTSANYFNSTQCLIEGRVHLSSWKAQLQSGVYCLCSKINDYKPQHCQNLYDLKLNSLEHLAYSLLLHLGYIFSSLQYECQCV